MPVPCFLATHWLLPSRHRRCPRVPEPSRWPLRRGPTTPPCTSRPDLTPFPSHTSASSLPLLSSELTPPSWLRAQQPCVCIPWAAWARLGGSSVSCASGFSHLEDHVGWALRPARLAAGAGSQLGAGAPCWSSLWPFHTAWLLRRRGKEPGATLIHADFSVTTNLHSSHKQNPLTLSHCGTDLKSSVSPPDQVQGAAPLIQ